MSAPAPSGTPTGREERRASLTKYVKRFKSALKRASTSGPSAGEPASPAGPSSGTGAIEATTPAKGEPAAAPSTGVTAPGPDPQPMTAPELPRTVTRSVAQQERARVLFAKYGLTLEPHEWITAPPSDVRRVEKPIRMRVHRTCHRCQTTFGADKVCANCEHRRCKKCPRYPPRRPKGDGGDIKGKGVVGKEVVEESRTRAKPRTGPVTVTTRTRDLPPMRISPGRETCHNCDEVVVPVPTSFCPSCKHVRCDHCTKDDRWEIRLVGPEAGDQDAPVAHRVKERMVKKPRMRVRWTCENCSKMFEASTKTCRGCGHERCQTCIREPPKKPKKEFDPDVVRAVEARLAAMSI